VANVGDGFQVHVFGDPGMEMMPECSGRMCYRHKHMFFNDFTVSTYSRILCLEGVVCRILVCFGDLGGTFSDFFVAGNAWFQGPGAGNHGRLSSQFADYQTFLLIV